MCYSFYEFERIVGAVGVLFPDEDGRISGSFGVLFFDEEESQSLLNFYFLKRLINSQNPLLFYLLKMKDSRGLLVFYLLRLKNSQESLTFLRI